VPADVKPSVQSEVMLAGWQESHNGGAKVTFWLPSTEALEPFRFATVRKNKTAGQRYMMVLVEIDEQEKPVAHPSNDAHLMVTSERFLEYAKQSVGSALRASWDTARAKAWAKYTIGVQSLSELDSDPTKLEAFHRLVRIPFAKWQHEQSGDFHEYDDMGDGDGMATK
jgi:hypothetical protein